MTAQKNRVLIILGMHRSGTSLVAQWLHACGLHLGSRLIMDSVGNEKGHCEDLDFHDLHEAIFRSNRIPYGGLERLSRLHICDRNRTALRRLIQKKNALNRAWGWKDPRTCLFVDAYEDFIDSATYVIVYRSAGEVVDSLLRRRREMIARGYFLRHVFEHLRYRFSNETYSSFVFEKWAHVYARSWVQYNSRILAHIDRIEEHRFKVVHYSTLVHKQSEILSWLNEQGFALQGVPYEKIFCDRMIDRGGASIATDPDTERQVQAIEGRFRELVVGSTSATFY